MDAGRYESLRRGGKEVAPGSSLHGNGVWQAADMISENFVISIGSMMWRLYMETYWETATSSPVVLTLPL